MGTVINKLDLKKSIALEVEKAQQYITRKKPAQPDPEAVIDDEIANKSIDLAVRLMDLIDGSLDPGQRRDVLATVGELIGSVPERLRPKANWGNAAQRHAQLLALANEHTSTTPA